MILFLAFPFGCGSYLPSELLGALMKGSPNSAELDNEMFAFVSNGEIIIVGEGTLQVIDMMGRIIVQRRDGACTVSTKEMIPGVYVLRLINGDKVKSQKIVIP